MAAQRKGKAEVLLVGSSIFGMWEKAAEQLAPLSVANVAINGSFTTDHFGLIGPLVLPRRPSIIVYYCGSNDISYGATAEQVAHNFVEYSSRLRLALPDVRIIYLGVLKCADKYGKFEIIDTTNAIVKEFCDATAHHYFVDINSQLLHPNGETAKDELFEDDNLHLLPTTYTTVVVPALKPLLTKLCEDVSQTSA